MIAEAVFDYGAQPMESVGCNLCGSSFLVVPPHSEDRYGYPVLVARCSECGLVCLCVRMTAEAYRQFYESGAYRRLVSAYHGREINAETIQDEQGEYADDLAGWLAPHIPLEPGALLDVGGSTGVVARYLTAMFGFQSAAVLEPSQREIEHAVDLTTYPGTAESFDPAGRTWDLITLCQTIDHLLDPMGVLKKLRGCLTEDGLLFVDAVDYNATKEIKIDHPYNFTEATMAEMLKRAGFREVARERAPDGVHVRFLCARAA